MEPTRHDYELVSYPKPTPEEMVDIFCPHCIGYKCSTPKGLYSVYDTAETTYKEFIGYEHLIDGTRNLFSCPNGCIDHNNDKVIMLRFDETHNLTPLEEWLRAELRVKRKELLDQVKDIEEELYNLYE